MTLLLSILFLLNDTIPDSTSREKIDTLRQIIVTGETRSPLEKAIESSLARQKQPSVPTLGDVLERVSPGINDKMLHPFAIKQRKRERKHKRDMKILDEYDRVITFQDLLDQAVKQQQLEDEAEKRRIAEEKEAHKIVK